MSALTLSFISNFNERVEPLMNGTIKADGIEIDPDLFSSLGNVLAAAQVSGIRSRGNVHVFLS